MIADSVTRLAPAPPRRAGLLRLRLLRLARLGLVALLVGFGLAGAGCIDDGGGGGEAGPDVGAPAPAPADPIPFAVVGESLGVRAGAGQDYAPLFIEGVNLGVAVPGTLAGQLAATREDYDRWLVQMGEAGFNTVRVYTLHYPRFYEALDAYNEAHPEAPIYVLHGVWLGEENPTGDLVDMTADFDAGIREVVDCVHGACSIAPRYGRAFGDYTVDVSRWTLGWIIGREVAPGEVMITNDANPGLTSFEGEHVAIDHATPTEVWFTERLDRLIAHERGVYGSERPVSVANWPTLDPIEHPTENPAFTDEDVASLDLAGLRLVDAPAGFFATFHAYPYYPNFVRDDPDYRRVEDHQGPNAYLAYLMDLREHYAPHPVLVGETGVPSSWGNAHSGHAGMNHGGHSEVEQGEAMARLMRNAHEAATAGAVLFAWIDEWWKPTWITDPREAGIKRRSLWHNVTAAEQNFGLVAFEPGLPDFELHPPVTAPVEGGQVEARVAYDAAFARLRLDLDRPLGADETLVVGIDTYRDDLGETVLPGDTATEKRHEFALVVEGDEATLHVVPSYSLQGIWHGTSTDAQTYRSSATEAGEWEALRWQNGQGYESEDGELVFEPTYFDAGRLRVRRGGEEATSLDAVVVGAGGEPGRVEIRLPWTLLNVVDPSQRAVMHDDRSTSERETATTQGFGFSVVRDGALLLETPRLGWQGWEEAPATVEREKASLEIVSEALRALP